MRAEPAPTDARGGDRGWLAHLRLAGAGLVRLPRPLVPLLVFGWMAGIWSLSSSSRLVDGGFLVPPLIGNLAHAPAFGLLALWTVLLSPREGSRLVLARAGLLAAFALALGYAIVDEVHQGFVPGRRSSPFDVLTDAVGAAAVLWTVSYVNASAAAEAGVRRRLLLGLLACVAAAALATLGGRLLGEPAPPS